MDTPPCSTLPWRGQATSSPALAGFTAYGGAAPDPPWVVKAGGKSGRQKRREGWNTSTNPKSKSLPSKVSTPHVSCVPHCLRD